MPKPPPPKRVEPEPAKRASTFREVRESGRWMCPKCRAVHHFDSASGCRSDRCPYKGQLVRVSGIPDQEKPMVVKKDDEEEKPGDAPGEHDNDDEDILNDEDAGDDDEDEDDDEDDDEY